MILVEIPMTPAPKNFSVVLGGIAYRWKLYWLVPAQCWVVDIGLEEGGRVICGIPLVTGGDLLGQFGYVGVGGDDADAKLFVISDQLPPDTVPDFTHLGSTGHVYYMSNG